MVNPAKTLSNTAIRLRKRMPALLAIGFLSGGFVIAKTAEAGLHLLLGVEARDRQQTQRFQSSASLDDLGRVIFVSQKATVDNEVGGSYAINLPTGDAWKSNPNLAAEIGAEVLIEYHEQIDGFVPNVNVTVGPSFNFSIEKIIELNQRQFEEAGAKIINVSIDPENNSAFVTLSITVGGRVLDQVQRYVVGGGIIYLATASVPAGLTNDDYPNIGNEIGQILGSLRIE